MNKIILAILGVIIIGGLGYYYFNNRGTIMKQISINQKGEYAVHVDYSKNFKDLTKGYINNLSGINLDGFQPKETDVKDLNMKIFKFSDLTHLDNSLLDT